MVPASGRGIRSSRDKAGSYWSGPVQKIEFNKMIFDADWFNKYEKIRVRTRLDTLFDIDARPGNGKSCFFCAKS